MGLARYMVGLIVRDMKATVDFYRHLGLAIPEASQEKTFVEVKMTGKSLFFDSSPSKWDPQYGEHEETKVNTAAGSHSHVLEFNLLERDDVDTMYAKLTVSAIAAIAAIARHMKRSSKRISR
ncbi:MAG TPA: VOC family protein [Ktedonobacterales bacterium]|nr:VOC family protein [Ktedonobacterales bacterium]